MAIKPPDLLNRIPSVAELLDKPPIRALADKWNRSIVAGGVKSFLDELRTDLTRRAAEVTLPTIRDLAERAARYVVTRQHQTLGVAINATGRIWGPPWTGVPLSDVAMERAIATSREFVFEPSPSEGKSAQIDSLLRRLTGAQAAAVVHSYAGAAWLALATLATDREVLVARADVGDVGDTDSLPNLARAARVSLTEIGTTHSARAADFEAAASDRTTAILKLSSDTYRIVGQTAAELDELVGLAHDRELVSIDALGAAPLVDPPPAVSWPRRSARASIAAGADLVLIRGDGLVGGPPCGILLGNQEVIRRIIANPLIAAWKLDPSRLAALHATLECYDNPTATIDSIPVWQCLTVSIDNLRNRAERMAPQLAHADSVASAAPVETRSPISAALPDGLPSYGVALSPAGGDIGGLEKRLQSARFPILGRVEDGRIILDLRTVLPRQDMTLIDALTVATPADAVPQNIPTPTE